MPKQEVKTNRSAIKLKTKLKDIEMSCEQIDNVDHLTPKVNFRYSNNSSKKLGSLSRKSSKSGSYKASSKHLQTKSSKFEISSSSYKGPSETVSINNCERYLFDWISSINHDLESDNLTTAGDYSVSLMIIFFEFTHILGYKMFKWQ